MAASIYEPRHEISNNVVCATSKGSDQTAHKRSLIRAFASCLIFYECYATDRTAFGVSKLKKGAAQDHLCLHLSKYHIVGNHMSRLNYDYLFCSVSPAGV